jgi:hypothetical protein
MILLSCSKDMRRAPNESINFAPAAPDAAKLRRLFRRLCRAWHRTDEVRVLTPGIGGAEG